MTLELNKIEDKGTTDPQRNTLFNGSPNYIGLEPTG